MNLFNYELNFRKLENEFKKTGPAALTPIGFQIILYHMC